MPAMGSAITTTSTRYRTLWPTRRAWWASTPSSGSWTTLSRRRPDAHRILAAGVRGVAPQRPGRTDGSDLGLRAPPRARQRAPRVRPDAHRRAEPQRHQGPRRAVSRGVEHGGPAPG